MEEKYGSFEKEVFQLVKGKKNQLSKPIEYFFCAAIVAFEYAFKQRKSQRNLTLMSERYLDFLSVVFWSIEEHKMVTPAMMEDEQLINSLRDSNWAKYSEEVVGHYPEMLEKLAPRYFKFKKARNNEKMEEG